MKTYKPHALDVLAFVEAGASLSGDLPLRDCRRLWPSLAAGAEQAQIAWQVQGLRRTAGAAGRQPALRLALQGALPLTCQRCMEPMQQPIAHQRHVLFAPDEQTAERWDQEVDDDVLALPQSLDLLALLEDELILALPLIPKHDRCARAPRLSVQSDGFATAAKPDHPFSVLAQLKKDKPH